MAFRAVSKPACRRNQRKRVQRAYFGGCESVWRGYTDTGRGMQRRRDTGAMAFLRAIAGDRVHVFGGIAKDGAGQRTVQE